MDLQINWKKFETDQRHLEMLTQAWLELIDLLSIVESKQLNAIERAKLRRAENFLIGLEFYIDKAKSDPNAEKLESEP